MVIPMAMACRSGARVLTFVQGRNAGSSVCPGLPAPNRNSGGPP
jgi:hypothetical protein